MKHVISSYLYGGQLSVTEVAQGQGSYVAFKTDISNIPNNTCPPSYKNLKFSVISTTGEKYSWIKTTGLWKHVNCRTGWKRFERDDETVVCMRYFRAVGFNTQPDAIISCTQQNATLTGIASMEEAKWVQEYTILNATYGVWIGGARDCPDDPCTTFVWTDEYTTLYDALNLAQVSQKKNSPYFEDCLAILPPKNDTDAIIFSYVCGSPLLASVCGYKIEF